MTAIDDPKFQDNRRYRYPVHSNLYRAEYPLIADWVRPGSRVIDFGCGDGSLLELLGQRSETISVGYDISQSGIDACKNKSIHGVCDRIDKHHIELSDKSFEYAICNVTIQMVEFPERLLQEMARVSTYQIISFPNFAYYKNRLDMFLKGRMPRPMLFGYQWFSTGHIHQLSVKDFREFIQSQPTIEIQDERHIGSENMLIKPLVPVLSNIFSKISIFLLSS